MVGYINYVSFSSFDLLTSSFISNHSKVILNSKVICFLFSLTSSISSILIIILILVGSGPGFLVGTYSLVSLTKSQTKGI